MKTPISIFLLMISAALMAQPVFNLNYEVIQPFRPVNSITRLEKGSQIKISSVPIQNSGTSSTNIYVAESGGEKFLLRQEHLKNLRLLDNKLTTDQLWQLAIMDSRFPSSFLKEGLKKTERAALNEENRMLISNLSNNGCFFNDPYITDYLRRLLCQISGPGLRDGRPAAMNVLVIFDPWPRSYSFSNGTILLSTGLFSTLSSEEEMISVLTREVAHIVMDHQFENYSHIEYNTFGPEFWYEYYQDLAIPGNILANLRYDLYTGYSQTTPATPEKLGLPSPVTEKLGLKYTDEQNKSASIAAKRILKHLGIDTLALTSADTRIVNFFSGQFSQSTSLLPETGDPSWLKLPFYDLNYIRELSMISTLSASYFLKSGYYSAADLMVTRNIVTGVATEDDYLIKAELIARLQDSPESTARALKYLEMAETVQVNPRYYLPRLKALAYLRLNQTEEAIAELKKYLSALKTIQPDDELLNEMEWVRGVLFKLGG
ncbi:MAG: M48 family metalloprotease [Bacteroidota bacterium]